MNTGARVLVLLAALSAAVVLLLAVFGGRDERPTSIAEPAAAALEPPAPIDVVPVADLRTFTRGPQQGLQSTSVLPPATVPPTTGAGIDAEEETGPFDATRDVCDALAEENWGFIARITVREMREFIAEEASWFPGEVFTEPRWMAGVPGETRLGEAAGEFVRWDDSSTLRAAFADFQDVRRQWAAREGPESTDSEGIEIDRTYIREVLGPRVIDASGLGARRLYDLIESFSYLDLTEEIE